MGQISIHNVTPKQTGHNHDVLSEVVIRPDLEQHWFDALGQFAGMMRLQYGMKVVVDIKDEKGIVNSAGELVITAGVHSETLQMAFPAGSWCWKDGELA